LALPPTKTDRASLFVAAADPLPCSALLVTGVESSDALTRLFHQANADPRMGALCTRYLNGWKDAGGGLFCNFPSVGRWSEWGSWGLPQFSDGDEGKGVWASGPRAGRPIAGGPTAMACRSGTPGRVDPKCLQVRGCCTLASTASASMNRLYLDYNCFQRSFDDLSQTRILMESLACQDLFARADRGDVELVWSFMHADETALCPFVHRRVEALRLADVCRVRVGPDDEAVERAKQLQDDAGLSPKDALHLACAVVAGATAFLTCDDRLVRQAQRAPADLEAMNPLDYWRREYT